MTRTVGMEKSGLTENLVRHNSESRVHGFLLQTFEQSLTLSFFLFLLIPSIAET